MRSPLFACMAWTSWKVGMAPVRMLRRLGVRACEAGDGHFSRAAAPSRNPPSPKDGVLVVTLICQVPLCTARATSFATTHGGTERRPNNLSLPSRRRAASMHTQPSR